MKQHQYRITVEHLETSQGAAVKRWSLRFEIMTTCSRSSSARARKPASARTIRPPQVVAALVQWEGRVLVTLSLGFANIQAYPPEQLAGIIVLRLVGFPIFRLILYWNQSLISGSRCIGNAPHFQAHHALDNSNPAAKPGATLTSGVPCG
jgi:hypothetical protein